MRVPSFGVEEELLLVSATGDPLPSTGLTYDPLAATQGASNSLNLQGGSFTSETYNATGAGAGTVTYGSPGGGTRTITFSNLSPMTDTVSSPTYIFNAPAGSTTVNVEDGPVVNTDETTEINDGGRLPILTKR